MWIKKWLGLEPKPNPSELLIRAAVLLIVKEMRNTEAKLMSTLDDVIAKVAEQGTVVASAAALIDGLQDKLAEALKSGVDQNKIKDILDALDADKAKLAEAIKENTVAELEPEVTPIEEPAPSPEAYEDEDDESEAKAENDDWDAEKS